MTITKNDLVGFIQSFGDLKKINDPELRSSLILLSDIIKNKWLLEKQKDYILNYSWEINNTMYMSLSDNQWPDRKCDLMPYYLSYKRENI